MSIPVVTVGDSREDLVGRLERLHGPVSVVRRCSDRLNEAWDNRAVERLNCAQVVLFAFFEFDRLTWGQRARLAG